MSWPTTGNQDERGMDMLEERHQTRRTNTSPTPRTIDIFSSSVRLWVPETLPPRNSKSSLLLHFILVFVIYTVHLLFVFFNTV